MKLEVTYENEYITNSFSTKLQSIMLSSKNHTNPTDFLLCPNSLSLENYKEMELLMNFFDEDQDGKISPTELKKCINNIGEEITLEDVEDLFMSIDSDGDGQLCMNEFTKIAKMEEETEEEKKKYLSEAFKVYEMNGEGCVTPRSLKITLDRLGQNKSIEECTEMIRRYDINGDGVICYEEFEIMMLQAK